MELTLYATFTAACFLSPSVTNVLGPRTTLGLGVLGYAALVAASLVYALVREPWCDTLVVCGGGVLGVGAACLWTAQGRLLLEWADGSEQASNFAIFWACFNASALAGGLLTFFYFCNASGGAPWPLYLIFLVLMAHVDLRGLV